MINSWCAGKRWWTVRITSTIHRSTMLQLKAMQLLQDSYSAWGQTEPSRKWTGRPLRTLPKMKIAFVKDQTSNMPQIHQTSLSPPSTPTLYSLPPVLEVKWPRHVSRCWEVPACDQKGQGGGGRPVPSPLGHLRPVGGVEHGQFCLQEPGGQDLQGLKDIRHHSHQHLLSATRPGGPVTQACIQVLRSTSLRPERFRNSRLRPTSTLITFNGLNVWYAQYLTFIRGTLQKPKAASFRFVRF